MAVGTGRNAYNTFSRKMILIILKIVLHFQNSYNHITSSGLIPEIPELPLDFSCLNWNYENGNPL